MAVFSYSSELEGKNINISSSSSELEEKNIHAYNDSSAVYIIDDDFGSITEGHVIDDDYGSILDDDVVGARYQDYGLITINETIVPYGSIDIGDDSFAQLKLIKVDVGKVTLTVLGEAYIFTTPIEFGSGTFKFHGTASPVVIKLSHFGSGQFSTLSGSAEVVGIKYPESTALFRITGFAVERNTESYVGSGSLFGLSSATEVTSSVKEGRVLFTITGEAIPVVSLSHIGSGSLFTFVSATEAVGSNPPESTALFKISGSAVEKNTESYVGSGSLFTFISSTETSGVFESAKGIFKITGEATPIIITLAHFGSGSLFGFSSTTEAVGSNPPESTVLFRFVGVADEQFVKNNTQSTEGQLLVRGESQVVFSRGYQTTGQFNVEGSATESISPAPYVGEGLITTKPVQVLPAVISDYADVQISALANTQISELVTVVILPGTSATVSVTYNPPEEGTLFTLSDAAVEKITDSYVGSGSLKFGRDASTTIFSLGHIGSVKIDIEGALQESIAPAPHVGTGTLFTFTGSSESITIDPVDKTTLFTFAGSATEKATNIYTGSGILNLESSSITNFNLLHIGSGSLFSFISSTESVVSNPPESTALFRITGKVAESISPAPYIGTGSLFTFVSATESKSTSEVYQGLFRIYGDSKNLYVINNIGSGSLFGFSGSSEAIAVVPPKETALFRFTGTALEKNTESYVGSGSLFTFISFTESSAVSERARGLFKFTGSAIEKNTETYLGFGTLFGFSSATEAVGSNPPESTALFKFSGSAVEKNTESYVGSGTLFGFSSTTEAVGSNPPESIALFKISGSATESVTPAPHVGSGSIFTFVSATETRAISEVSTGRFKFSGSAVEKNTESYVGSGTLFGFSSTTEAVVVNPPESTALFRFTGSATESIAPAPHVGSGSIFTFVSFTETIAISPDDTKVLFTFVGEATNKKTDSYRGTGSLFAITGSYEATVIVPQITTILFNIFGRAFERYGYANYDGIGFSQMEGLATTSRVEFEPAKPVRIMVI